MSTGDNCNGRDITQIPYDLLHLNAVESNFAQWWTPEIYLSSECSILAANPPSYSRQAKWTYLGQSVGQSNQSNNQITQSANHSINQPDYQW